eukprot:g52089.t1
MEQSYLSETQLELRSRRLIVRLAENFDVFCVLAHAARTTDGILPRIIPQYVAHLQPLRTCPCKFCIWRCIYMRMDDTSERCDYPPSCPSSPSSADDENVAVLVAAAAAEYNVNVRSRVIRGLEEGRVLSLLLFNKAIQYCSSARLSSEKNQKDTSELKRLDAWKGLQTLGRCWRDQVEKFTTSSTMSLASSLKAQNRLGEGSSVTGSFRSDQGHKAKHRQSAVQLLGALVEAPASAGLYHFHAWLFGESVEATTILLSDFGAL